MAVILTIPLIFLFEVVECLQRKYDDINKFIFSETEYY